MRTTEKRHQPSRAPKADSHHPAVDAYISRAAPFAQPILTRLRAVVHRACPGVTETIKWGMPAFEYKGPLAGMAAFKSHCAFRFWNAKLLATPEGAARGSESSTIRSLERIRSLLDLPPAGTMARLVKQAAALNDAGVKVARQLDRSAAIRMPPEFARALRDNPRALRFFDSLVPTHKRQYLDWIVKAKSSEARRKRIATAIERLSQGRRSWKPQRSR